MRFATFAVSIALALTAGTSFARMPRGDVGAEPSPDRGSLRGTAERPSRGMDINRDGPRIERGRLVNDGPRAVERDPSPVERVARKVMDSPVTPYYERRRGAGLRYSSDF